MATYTAGRLEKFESDNKLKIQIPMKITQIKLGEIFEVEGILYSITLKTLATGSETLSSGRTIFEFDRI